MKRTETISVLVAHGVITCGSILFCLFYRWFDWRILEASRTVFPEITKEKYSVLQQMVFGNTWLIATPLIIGMLLLLGALRWPLLGSRVTVARMVCFWPSSYFCTCLQSPHGLISCRPWRYGDPEQLNHRAQQHTPPPALTQALIRLYKIEKVRWFQTIRESN